jgi:hypothetical protein
MYNEARRNCTLMIIQFSDTGNMTHQTVSLTLEWIHDENPVTGTLCSKILSVFMFHIHLCFKFQTVSVATVLCIINVIQQFPSFFGIPL